MIKYDYTINADTLTAISIVVTFLLVRIIPAMLIHSFTDARVVLYIIDFLQMFF